MNDFQSALLKSGVVTKKQISKVNKKKYEELKQQNLKEKSDRIGKEITEEVKKKFGGGL